MVAGWQGKGLGLGRYCLAQEQINQNWLSAAFFLFPSPFIFEVSPKGKQACLRGRVYCRYTVRVASVSVLFSFPLSLFPPPPLSQTLSLSSSLSLPSKEEKTGGLEMSVGLYYLFKRACAFPICIHRTNSRHKLQLDATPVAQRTTQG